MLDVPMIPPLTFQGDGDGEPRRREFKVWSVILSAWSEVAEFQDPVDWLKGKTYSKPCFFPMKYRF